jgi:hypothetical protein
VPVKSIAILLLSLAVVGLVLWICLWPPKPTGEYVIGDDKCDFCGQPAVYRLWLQDRFLQGEYCRRHRWIGMANADPWRKGLYALLAAGVFGVIHSVLSILGRTRQRPQDGDA